MEREGYVESIIKVLMVASSKWTGFDDVEYVDRNGMLMISRVKEAKALDQMIHSSVNPQIKETSIQEAGAIALAVDKPGLLDSLYFATDFEHGNELRLDEVEIKVQFVGLNFRDLLVALGRDITTFPLDVNAPESSLKLPQLRVLQTWRPCVYR